MSDTELSPLKRALVALDRMQAELDQAERARRSPIAIVGMACRFPGGADSPGAFWQLLVEGRDVIVDVPADRWDIDAYFDPDPDTPGKMSTRQGGFLGDVSGFEPRFFGISPREAQSMDPQQRLLLEVAWESLEDAGIAPDRLRGSRTGVFVGLTTSDYAQLQLESAGLAGLDAYSTSGTAHSIASGRLSYVLGLQGPSITLDTACSSSLVAVHLAVQSLRAGDSDAALAGGVNLILTPDNSIMLSKFHMMAPDARCKTFDASADGFVRGEGCGLVVLKRLADAERDGDRILAIIRGSAINQDGASSGLTAPNGPAQEAVVRDALADGGVAAADVVYVETHGTGTALGDPIEVQALAAALGSGRAEPVALGSVKTNVGHLESVAGVAGLIKAVLVLTHREIPPHLHLVEPNPHIEWDRLPVTVPVTRTPLSADRPAIAGVSAFGFSGTNAHVVLEAGPPVGAPAGADQPSVLMLSARTGTALQSLAGAYAHHLDRHADLSLLDVCATANAGRARFAHRAAITAGSRTELSDRLRSVADGRPTEGVRMREVTSADPPRIAFMFTGQGSQHHGMATELQHREPCFRAAFERTVALFDEELSAAGVTPSLSAVLQAETGSPTASLLDETQYTQPALFALEWALSEQWREWGVVPSVLIGHSLGEIVAAVVAGVLSLGDGVRLVAARGRLMQALPSGGAMLAVFAAEHEVADAVAAAVQRGAAIAIAAVNGPAHSVVSGAADDVDALQAEMQRRGVRTQRLTVSHAFHSPLMEPMVSAFRRVATSLTYHPPRRRIISNVSAELSGRDLADPEYWVRHVTAPVRFADGVGALVDLGIETFLEIGPHPVLTGMGQACVPAGFGTWAATLHRRRSDVEQSLDALAVLDLAGVGIDWTAVGASRGGRRVPLPTYPFERERHWVRPRPRSGSRSSPDEHPLLGRRLRSPLSSIVFEQELTTESIDYVGDHRVQGTAILPATAFVEIGLAAGRRVIERPALSDLVIHDALVVPDGAVVVVQTIVDRSDGGASFRVFSQVEGDDEWRTHATGAIVTGSIAVPPSIELHAARTGSPDREIDGAAHDALLASRGLAFGPSLRNVRRVQVAADGGVVAELHRSGRPGTADAQYTLHPALLDAALQVIVHAWAADEDLYLPLGVDRVTVWPASSPSTADAWAVVTLRPHAETATVARVETITADVVVADRAGAPIAQLQGVRLKRVDSDALARRGGVDRLGGWLYEVSWHRVDGTRGAADSEAAIRAAAASADRRAPELCAEQDIEHYDGLIEELERLSIDYVLTALSELGVASVAGTTFTADGLGVAPNHRRLLDHLLHRLAGHGIVAASPAGWEFTRSRVPDVSAARLERLLARYPRGAGELTITRRCGERLAGALTGAVDPLELLFPGGSLEAAEQMYRSSPFAHFFNSLAGEVVSSCSGSTVGRPLRVLEIGAGTGGTTAYVLPRLPAGASYTFTDVSPHFLNRARRTFESFPSMEYRLLDIEGDLETQGFGDRRFDIVVAANVLHATADLRHTFANVAKLLAPSGVLVMTEMVLEQTFISISFGLTEGWWKFVDTDVRPSSLLLDRDAWRHFLDGNGFVATHVLPGANSSPSSTRIQGVVVAARRDQEQGVVPLHDGDRSWLVLGAGDALGEQVAEEIRRRGGRAVVARLGGPFDGVENGSCEVDGGDPADVERMLADVAGGIDGIDRVVHLWSLDPSPGATVRERCRPSLGGALDVVRALVRRADPPRITLVTRQAQRTGDELEIEPLGALLWGFSRGVRLEHPELAPLCVDIDTSSTASDLVDAVLGAGQEDQLALRDGAVLGARLTPTGAEHAPDPYELTFTERGALDHLVVHPLARRAPGPDEVEIRVHAVGLNFKDVLNVLGMYPGDPGPLGGECAGVVTAVGAQVDGVAVGDRVVALAPGAFRSHAMCNAAFVAPLPPGVSFADGAAVAIAGITAEFSLAHVAGLRAGQRVLVHAAAGGVGSAAVLLAQRLGAEVFTTAGSEAKREHLRRLGVRHVYDSRSTDFAEAIRRDTEGAGVDVVLNSLTGAAVAASLDLLGEGGHFVEIGKRDHFTDEVTRSIERGVVYHVVDWTDDASRDPDLIRTMLSAAVARAADPAGRLPVRTFAIGEAVEAFRYMAAARHIGKVVVIDPAARGDAAAPIRADGTYLVTGGLRGLGLLTAEHLARRGARHLVLLGRRPPERDATLVLEQLQADGVDVVAVSADVSDRVALTQVLEDLRATMPPLRGVFHAAGALADAAVTRLTWSGVETVLAAKADGTALLDELTARDPLDHFVLYGSIASVFGGRGQSNHAAANAYLDAFASARSAGDRPGLSIGWGAWGGTGAAVERGVERRADAHGLGTIDPRDGFAVLDRLLAEPPSSAAVSASPVQWPRLLETLDGARSPFFSDVARIGAGSVGTVGSAYASPPTSASGSHGGPQLAQLVAGVAVQRRRGVVAGFVREQVARVLSMPETSIGDGTPLSDLGMDSLMAVELRNLIGAAAPAGRSLPATLVFDHPTVGAIAAYLLDEVLGEVATASDEGAVSARTDERSVPRSGGAVSSLLDDLEGLSDEEIEAQLARRSRT